MSSFNILNDYDPSQYNLLIPVQSIQEVNPIYRIVVNQVSISTNMADKEIYEEKNAEKVNNHPMYALTHKALTKLLTAANGQIVESARIRPKACEKCIEIVKATQIAPACGTCPCVANVAYRCTIKLPELSGGWRVVQASREIDFSQLSNAKPGMIARMKEFASEHAESKAMSRAIRKGLSIKNAYTLDELRKPFIVAYPVLDAKDNDVKKALIAGSLAASNLLYGTGFTTPQIAAAPSEQDEHVAGYEADYECESADTVAYPWEPGREPDHDAPPVNHKCSKCGTQIAENVSNYSMNEFGAELCIRCQNKQKGVRR